MLRIPRLSVTEVEGGEPEIEITDSVGSDSYESLDVSCSPILVTMARIGNHCIVDPSPEEEECSSATLLLAVTPQARTELLTQHWDAIKIEKSVKF